MDVQKISVRISYRDCIDTVTERIDELRAVTDMTTSRIASWSQWCLSYGNGEESREENLPGFNRLS